MAGTVEYADWLQTKREFKQSTEDRKFAEHRVRKLQDEERAVLRNIAATKAKREAIEAAKRTRALRQTHRTRAREEEAARTAQRKAESARARQEGAVAIAAAVEQVRQRNSSARKTVSAQRDRCKRSISARRSEDEAKLARRRELIRDMQRQCVESRRQFLTDKQILSQRSNARVADELKAERDANVHRAADLTLVEAELLKRLSELHVSATKEAKALAELVTGEERRVESEEDSDTERVQ